MNSKAITWALGILSFLVGAGLIGALGIPSALTEIKTEQRLTREANAQEFKAIRDAQALEFAAVRAAQARDYASLSGRLDRIERRQDGDGEEKR